MKVTQVKSESARLLRKPSGFFFLEKHPARNEVNIEVIIVVKIKKNLSISVIPYMVAAKGSVGLNLQELLSEKIIFLENSVVICRLAY
ncbi:hypothetical protein ACQ0QQ_16085 [Lysinibacillus sphaericus]